MRKIAQYLLFLLLGILLAVSVMIFRPVWLEREEKMAIKDSKVILYEGPLSMRDATKDDLESLGESSRDMSLLHCTDTQVFVNQQECFVYDTNVNNSRSWYKSYLPPQSRTPIAYFDFEGTVEIKVKVKDIDIEDVKISPLSYEIEPVVDKKEHTVTFLVNEPDTYTIQFNNSPNRAVHIFAYEIEDPDTIPNPEDENVIYLGPGEWNIDNLDLKNGQTIYLAGGCVAHGTISGDFVKDVTVKGHGILDGSQYAGWKGKNPHVPLRFDNCENVTIKDVIVLNSNAWVCQGFNSTNGLIDGIRIISSRPNGDGITLQSCQNYEVKNCFVRSWDDSLVVKNYDKNSENITFKNMQLWTDLAQSMEIGFETNKGENEQSTISDVTFEDITVINNYHKPVISVHNADDALVEKIVFRNIIVEHEEIGSGDSNLGYLIDIAVVKNNGWSTTKKRGNIRDILIENVTFMEDTDTGSRITGYDEEHTTKNVTITNLKIGDREIKNVEDGNFIVNESSTADIRFE